MLALILFLLGVSIFPLKGMQELDNLAITFLGMGA